MYQILGVEQKILGNAVTPNSFLWSIANRISYWMNLSGPSLTIDTACSSSLTAMYFACEAIKKGDCTGAIVGGVNLDLHQHKLDINRAGGALSKDEACKSFGKGANGYVAGEGVSAIYLKPLEKAIEDRDNIQGVVKGIGINHGGRTSGYTVPSPRVQAKLISRVLEKADIDPRTIGYIEAHGTGTELGDPIEISGLMSAFQQCDANSYSCAIGSIKTNIGHLEAAAGLAGVTKVLLQMRYKRLVPSLHSQELNEHIDFEGTPFTVQQNVEEWLPKSVDNKQYPLRASVSSFGAGGSNAYVVLEQYLESSIDSIRDQQDGERYIFPLSARTSDQLRESAQRLNIFIAKDQAINKGLRRVAIQHIAYTLQVGRKAFEHRLVVVASSKEELREKLELFIKGEQHQDIILNNVKLSKSISRFLSSRENEEFMTLVLRNPQPVKIAQLWTEGIINDLQFIKNYTEGKIISLPTYPFAAKRHWLDSKGNYHRVSAAPHPLVDSNESTFTQQIFRKSFTTSEFCLCDHLVSGIPTLPGVAYLDIARVTGELASGRTVKEIYNIVLVSPLMVDGVAATQVTVELLPKGKTVQFEVMRTNTDEEKILCCQGKIAYSSNSNDVRQDEYLNIDEIKSRCNLVARGSEVYPEFKALGLDLGPSFQVLKDVFKSEDEILGGLELPTCRVGDFDKYLLHPSLMDGALQAGMAANIVAKNGEMFVPYSISSVEIIHPLTVKCYSYIQQDRSSESRLSKANVLITDETGKVLVKIKELIGVPLVSIHEEIEPASEDIAFRTLYYSYLWEEKNLKPAEYINFLWPMVIFADDALQRHIVGSLEGQSKRDIYFIRHGNENSQIDSKTFQVDPSKVENFIWLIKGLSEKHIGLESICYAWPVNDKSNGSKLGIGIYAFHLLCQGLIRSGVGNAKLIYLYEQTNDYWQASHEAVNGFVKSLHAESPNLQCRVLEIQNNLAASSKLLENLVSEFSNPNFLQETTVRYLSNGRQVRRVMEFDAKATRDPFSNTFAIKEEGVYIITGGLGGLGYIFAEYLSKNFKARLLLTGRSSLDEEKSKKIGELESHGAHVIYYQSDVSKIENVKDFISACKAVFGKINGLIHAAGILKDSLIKNKSVDEVKEVFAPKVQGCIALDKATESEALDFFVTFSSMAAVGGNIGQSDYAFANHFMDSFCKNRDELVQKGKRYGKSLSINWSIWAEGGMQLGEGMQQYFESKLGIRPLQTAVGHEAFIHGIKSEKSSFVVVEAQKEKMELAWGITESIPDKKDVNDKPVNPLREQDSSRTNRKINNESFEIIKNDISQLVKDFLKLSEEDLDVDSILLDLGFDSIGLATFANKINDKYNLDLSPIIFFEYPNIEKVSEFIASKTNIKSLYMMESPQLKADSVPAGKLSIIGDDDSLNIDKGFNFNDVDSLGQVSESEYTSSFVENRFINKPIAIVGMSGVMPQSDDLNEYWQNLINATDNMVTLVPEVRWSWQEYYGDPLEEENKTKSKWGGFMRQVDKFDPLFFGISPREAEMMDPQQRIFLQTVCGSIEDSGHKLSDLAGTRTGLFVGASTREYLDLMGSLHVQLDGYSASGTSHAILANRISYLLDLRGPSAPLDTACSSSLVALHRAIESIHTGSCDMAIVGGVQVMLTPAGFISFSAAGMLANDGRCKTFDESADGYVRGEGSGAVLIKPLSMAKQHGDHIYAIVRSTAENHGGKASMLTAPNRKAQTEVIVEAYEKAGVDPRSVGFMECHGTGTSLGDPIEIDALKNAFEILYRKNNIKSTVPHIGLTSAKTNIGHLETAAGIAGLLKVLLSIKHKRIPPLLHFNKLNPYINLEDSPFYIVDKPKPWEATKDKNGKDLPRLAGLSSFGFGGANVHIVLEEYCEKFEAAGVPNVRDKHLFVISAKNHNRLVNYVSNIRDHIEITSVQLDDLTYTLQVGRDAYESRLALVVTSNDELLEKLSAFLNQARSAEGLYTGSVKKKNFSILDDHVVRDLFDTQDYVKLAKMWCEGKQINWNVFYHESKPKRISIPTYPFAKERYWFEQSESPKIEEAISTSRNLHPLVHQNNSNLHGFSYLSRNSELNCFITQRRDTKNSDDFAEDVLTRSLLPTELIEIARFSILHAHGRSADGVIELNNVTFTTIRSFDLQDVTTDIKNPAFPHSSGLLRFTTFYSNRNSPSEQTISHDRTGVLCQGQAALIEYEYPASLDVELLTQKFHQKLDSTQVSEWFSGLYPGLTRGDTLLIENIKKCDQQLLATIKDEGCAIDNVDSRLRVLESVIQATAVLLFASERDSIKQICVSSIDSIRFISERLEARYIWVYRSANSLSENIKSKNSYDIVVSDFTGNICLRICDFAISANVGQSSNLISESHAESLLLLPRWGKTTYQVNDRSLLRNYDSSSILLLGFDRDDRASVQKLTSVSMCENYIFDEILELDKQCRKYACAVFDFVKSLAADNTENPREVYVFINHQVSDLVAYELLGLFNALKQEQADFNFQIIVLLTPLSSDELIDRLLGDVGDCSNQMLRYTSVGLQQLKWYSPNIKSSYDSSTLFSSNKNYLIAGGLGKLGLILAKEILETTLESRVILTGRSNKLKNNKKIQNAFGDKSTRVVYKKMDVKEQADVDRVIDEVSRSFGSLDGIIHVAGIKSDAIIGNKTKQDFDEIISTKVSGAHYLDEATKSMPLDFFIMFSSIVSVFGNAGQTDYATANGFLDGFAKYRNDLVRNNQRHGKSISINWPLWKEGGMHISEEAQDVLYELTGMLPLPTRSGIEQLYRCWNEASDQALVIFGQREKMAGLLSQISLDKPSADMEIYLGNNQESIDYSGKYLNDKEVEFYNNSRIIDLKQILNAELENAE